MSDIIRSKINPIDVSGANRTVNQLLNLDIQLLLSLKPKIPKTKASKLIISNI